jgi:hypothetical protein
VFSASKVGGIRGSRTLLPGWHPPPTHITEGPARLFYIVLLRSARAKVTLMLATPNRASDSLVRNLLGVFILAAGFLSSVALLPKAVADRTVCVAPASFVAIVILLFWVIEPKSPPRLRAIYPALQTTGVPAIVWVVRALSVYSAAVG